MLSLPSIVRRATIPALQGTLAGVLPAMLLATALTPSVAGAASAAYRCEAPGEPPRFSQFPCGAGVRLELPPAQIVGVPPLSEAERARLEALDADRRREQVARARARRQAAAAAANQRREDARRCDSARSGLEALERRRRKGYSLSESRGLDRREAALAEEIARYC